MSRRYIMLNQQQMKGFVPDDNSSQPISAPAANSAKNSVQLNQDEMQQFLKQNTASQNQSQTTSTTEQPGFLGDLEGISSNWLKLLMPQVKKIGSEAPQLLGAGALNIPKQVYNMIAQGTNQLGGNLTPATFDPNKVMGLPTDQSTEGLRNLVSGGLGALAFGPEAIGAGSELSGSLLGRGINLATSRVLPQAGMGAALDPQNRLQGATVGGGLSLLNPTASGLRNTFGTGNAVIDNARSVLAAKNAGLNARSQNSTNKFVSQLMARRLDNQEGFQTAYSAEQQAGNHPIPNLPSPLKTSMNNVADRMDDMFGPTPASQDVRDYPEQYSSNYTPEEGFTPDAQENIDKLLGSPGLGEILSKNYTRDSDLGGNNNPLQPLKAYQDLVMDPTVQTASEAKRVFHILKDSDYTSSIPGLQSKLKTAANSIDKNMTLPGLKNYDDINGTNLYDQYLQGSPQYKEEMEYSGMPQIDSLSSGGWLPGSMDPKSVAQTISSLAKTNKIPNSPLGDFLRQQGSSLQAAITKNMSQQAQNKVIQAQKIAKIRNRGGPLATVSNLIGGTSKWVSPIAQTYGLGKLQAQNPNQ